MLAVWLGLRQSEILGLEWRDIDGDTLKIRRAIVLGEDGPTQKAQNIQRDETAPYPGLHPGTAGPAAPQRRPHCQHDREIHLLRVLPHLREKRCPTLPFPRPPPRQCLRYAGRWCSGQILHEAHGTRHKQYAENDVSTHHQRERSGVRPENRKLYW